MATFFIIAGIIALGFAISIGEPATARETRALAMIPNFSPGVRFQQADQKVILALDPATERFILLRNLREMRVYGFDELVSVELDRDGHSLQRTNRGSQVVGAAVGAALLGPVGLLLGGVTGSKRIEEKVKRMALKLYTNDLHKPVQEIVFFDQPTGLPLNHAMVQNAARELDEWYGRFMTVLHGQARSGPVAGPTAAPGASVFGRRRSLLAGQ